MMRFRKIWNEETNGFLTENKALSREELHKAFMERFPNSEVSFTALCNQLSRLGLRPHLAHGSTRQRPLYSEQVKKEYVRIKIAQPNVWISKSKWVYMETHPWEDFTERSNYIFLDGNNRNFHPDNIMRLPLRMASIFSNLGGCVKGKPEITRLRVLQAHLISRMLDRAEEIGLAKNYGMGRVLLAEQKWRRKEYTARPEVKARIAARARKRLHRMKEEEPERYAEMLRKSRERRRKK